MKILFFQQIVDSRFDGEDIQKTLCDRVEKIKSLLQIEGLSISVEKSDVLNFIDKASTTPQKVTQYRCKFYVAKNTEKISWNDIYKLVNSVKSTYFSFL
jgi:hypothetical protein